MLAAFAFLHSYACSGLPGPTLPQLWQLMEISFISDHASSDQHEILYNIVNGGRSPEKLV